MTAVPTVDSDRKLYLGASDMARIMEGEGVEVSLEKRGKIPSFQGNDATLRGTTIEPGLRIALATLDEEEVVEYDGSVCMSFPKLVEHADGIYPSTGWLAELKTASFYISDEDTEQGYGEEESDRVPRRYWWQAQTQIAVSGAPGVRFGVMRVGEKLFAALVRLMGDGGMDPAKVAEAILDHGDMRRYRVPRDDKVCAHIIETARDFWTRYVEGDETPQPVNLAQAKLLWPSSSEGEVVDVPADGPVIEVLRRQREVDAQVKALKGESDELKAHLAEVMGDAETLAVDGKKVVTWKTQTRKSYTVKEAEFRVMRIAGAALNKLLDKEEV